MAFTTYNLEPLQAMLPPGVSELRSAGWAPKISLPPVDGPYAPPSMMALKNPKQMSGTWRATKTHLLSSFNFNLTSITCRELHEGPSRFRMDEWMGIDPKSLSMRHQQTLAQRLSQAEKVVYEDAEEQTSHQGDVDRRSYGQKQANWQHRRTKYDTIVFGTLNDGTSMALHVVDFCPWLVFQFSNDKDMPIHAIESKIRDAIECNKDILGSITFEIQQRACSDGILPDRRNPYVQRLYNYVYIFTPDASYACRKKLVEELNKRGAVVVEDDALNESMHFIQQTKMCCTDWYTVKNWFGVQYGYVTSDQIEIACKVSDLISMIGKPEGIVLPPHTEFYWDIEHHKYASEELLCSANAAQSRSFANPDEPENNIMCINVAMWRTGVFEMIAEDDPCRRCLPRMDDEHVDLSSFLDANADDQTLDLPDPIDVEQSMLAKYGVAVRNVSISSDADMAQTNEEYQSDEDDEFNVVDPCMLNGEEYSARIDQVSDSAVLAENVQDLIRQMGPHLNVGNMTSDDLDLLDNIAEVTKAHMDGVETLPVVMENQDSHNGMDVDELRSVTPPPLATVAHVAPESVESKRARHGYEIPKWALSKLGARSNITLLNSVKAELDRTQTPIVLRNLKYIRRISFFVDPELSADKPPQRVLLKPLYEDESDGILVYAFHSEAAALTAFRDFMVYVHPEMTCGHFTRSYDWKTLFVRANLSLADTIPVKNLTRDSPIPVEKLMTHLPILEFRDMLSTPKKPFPVKECMSYYEAVTSPQSVPDRISSDCKGRQTSGKELLKKTSRRSSFAFMNRLLFCPVSVTRKITRSQNTAPVESVAPSFDGMADIDSLICIRLALPGLDQWKLNYLSKKFLKDAKMDITIPRMNACYRQKQYWAPIAYCDHDCILVGALMTVLSIRMAHAALSRCSYLPAHDIPNFGQQRRIFAKNAVCAADTNMVLVKCSIVCPQIFGGGNVQTPNGGLIEVPVPCLDYVSFYVTIMMTDNLCFTSYGVPFGMDFEPLKFDPYDPIAALKAYRTYQRMLRKVYGAPDYRRRPATLPYYTCLRCGSEDFSLVPSTVEESEFATLPSHEQLKKTNVSNLEANHPARCMICASKPWLGAVEPEYNIALVKDVTFEQDPYRELRYATDFDYFVPRSSMATFQSDPEAYDMHEIKRFRPGSSTEFVKEDLLTEHECFDWIDDDTWARQRYSKCYPAFLDTLKKKKYKNRDTKDIKYVPSNASFVLWRPADFDNQARSVYYKTASAEVMNSHPTKPLFDDPAERRMLDTIGGSTWTVDSFDEYAARTAALGKLKRMEAFRNRSVFDMTQYDIRSRRGIDKFGSTTGSVEQLFRSRKATTRLQASMKKNAEYYDSIAEKWLDGRQKSIYDGYQAKQLGEKGSANSQFGAAGAQSGSIKNTFVAAAITFMSRNMIHITTYTIVTRWCPPLSLYERICKYRAEAIKKKHMYSGTMKEYFDRYLVGAPWPTTPEAGFQSWLKPICSAYQFQHDPVESMWGIFNTYGDTDSIFPFLAALVLGDPDHPLFDQDPERLRLAFDIGTNWAEFVTSLYRMYGIKWMEIALEKIMWPFLLFHNTKKRYVAGHYEKPEKRLKITQRSWGIKRDMTICQQILIGAIRDDLIANKSMKSLHQVCNTHFKRMMSSKGRILDLEKDVIFYSKSQAFNKMDYKNPPCHVKANQRFALAYPGQEHVLGERIPYVICYDPSKPEIANRSWTVAHLKILLEERDNAIKAGLPEPRLISELRIDIGYYIDLCVATISDIYSIMKPPKQIYDRPCTFAHPDHPLQKLHAAGRWPYVILPNASLDLHLKHYEDVVQKKPHSMVSFNGMQLSDLKIVRARAPGVVRTAKSVLYLMSSSSGVGGTTTSSRAKQKSAAAEDFVRKYSFMARRILSESLSGTRIGIHAFYGAATMSKPYSADHELEVFIGEQSKKRLREEELAPMTVSMTPPGQTKTVAPSPNIPNVAMTTSGAYPNKKKAKSTSSMSQRSLITSFFRAKK